MKFHKFSPDTKVCFDALVKEQIKHKLIAGAFQSRGIKMKNYFIQYAVRIFVFSILILLLSISCPADDSHKDKWNDLLKRSPYVYTIPVVSENTLIEGTYVKKAKKEGAIVPCRRCPDWVPNPGIWKLNLSKGVYRIINTKTGWKSIGTYIISGDRIIFANDPCCIYGVGVYSWTLKEGKLELKIIDDPCAIKLRGKNLTEVIWSSCQPPNVEAAISTHWPKPKGCD